MRAKTFFELKPFKDCTDDEKQVIQNVINTLPPNASFPTKLSRARLTKKIIDIHGIENAFNLYLEYCSSHSQYRKIEISKGINAVKELKEKYKNRPPIPKDSLVSCFTIDYWVSRKGLSVEEAKLKLSENSTNAAKKAAKAKSSRNSREFSPLCEEYWILKGYDNDEALSLAAQWKGNAKRSLENYIKRYGVEEGTKKLEAQHLRRKATMIARYGTTITNGYVSKESLKFFIPLYKKLRKLGIEKDDICWGISGSKEFVVKSGETCYFYDFTIKSKKIVIEYHNTFWHPRENTKWKSPFYSLEEKTKQDENKRLAIEERGFTMVIVWNDDDFNEKTKLILEMIK